MPSRRSVTSVGPGVITVEKIELPLASAPPETPSQPVVGLKEVRLLHNMVVQTEDGKSKLLARGEVVSIDLVAPRWRTTEFVEDVSEYRRDKVCLLHDMSVCLPSFDGDRTVWRERLFSAYSLVDLKTLPNRIVVAWVANAV